MCVLGGVCVCCQKCTLFAMQTLPAAAAAAAAAPFAPAADSKPDPHAFGQISTAMAGQAAHVAHDYV